MLSFWSDQQPLLRVVPCAQIALTRMHNQYQRRLADALCIFPRQIPFKQKKNLIV